jgi:hypothetical protein
VGRRSRHRNKDAQESGGTTDYADEGGNVLKFRDSLSWNTRRQIANLSGSSASTRDDVWQRRVELLFERLAVSWTISGLPLTGQKELLGRYRMADSDTRRWVRETIDRHVHERHPELDP